MTAECALLASRPMSKFTLTAEITLSAHTIVEAVTLADAIVIAGSRDVVLGVNCSVEDAKGIWLIENANGTPENIHEG